MNNDPRSNFADWAVRLFTEGNDPTDADRLRLWGCVQGPCSAWAVGMVDGRVPDGSAYATAAQGVKADTALQPGALSGYVTTATLGGYATTSALTSALAGKFNNPAGSTSQYIRGDGSLATFPTVPALIQRQRLQTDASGNLTWTYPTAFPPGTVPIISAVSESASSTVPQGVQIVGTPTNASCVLKVINLPSTSVLSIVVLGAPAGAQAWLHLTAISP